MSEYTGFITQPSSSIRTRLVTAFLLIVMMPMIVLGVVLAISNTQGAEQQITNELRILASGQQTQVNSLIFDMKASIADLLAGETESSWIETMYTNTPESLIYNFSYEKIKGSLGITLQKNKLFDEYFITGTDGVIMLSTRNLSEGVNLSSQAFIKNGLKAAGISDFTIDTTTGAANLYVYRPLHSAQGAIVGVLVGKVNNDRFYSLLDVGNRSSTNSYLISSQFLLVSPSTIGSIGTRIESPGSLAALKGQENLHDPYLNSLGVQVIGVYKRVPDINAAIIVEEDLTEIRKASIVLIATNVSVGLASLIVAVFASLLVTRNISDPLSELAETATRIANGEVGLEAESERSDEIGTLSDAFNSMTTQLASSISNLEQRVQDRTKDLENRSQYLNATAEVSRAIGSILEFEPLVEQSTELIRSQFGLYYVGLFLLNEEGNLAILRSGTGRAGEIMLSRGHKITIGSGMVGWCIENNKARVASDAGQDSVRLATPELPQTRSEAALPLHSRGKVIGAITVQSEQTSAFDEMYISVLQIMADHVATALDNARLFDESRTALEATRKAYGETTRAAWSALTRRQGLVFRADEKGVYQVNPTAVPAGPENAPGMLRMPVVVRGEELGVILAQKPEDKRYWTREELALMETLVDQLGVALDNARLYNDTQSRAERERLIADITAKVRASTNLDVILQTSITELAQALRTPTGMILIRGMQDEGQGGAANE